MRFSGLSAISAAVLILLSIPTRVDAADYFVVGRVYSASPLAEGEAAPQNPLTGVAADQVIGEDLVAGTVRNLVKVRVLAASDGTELASYITREDGGYLASFSRPVGSIQVRFVVEELATSKPLLNSEPTTLTPPVSIRFLLVNEAQSEISSDHEFAPPPPSPAIYTGIFTRVGKIEVATKVGGVTQHLIDPVTGLANVPASVASDLSIPQYEDSPFGGDLYIFGALSQSLYSLPNVCYKIKITPGPSGAPFEYIDDELVKTKYTVDFTMGTLDTERVLAGPKTVGGTANCYELTPIAASDNVFWSFPDQLAQWRTASLNGNYRLDIELFGLSNPANFAPITNHTNMTLEVDNNPAVAQILPLADDPADLNDPYDTPRVYSPLASISGSPDLTATLLGSFPSDYGGTGNPTCSIFSLQPASPTKYLAFKLTAHHASSRLLSWRFGYQRNDGNHETLLGKVYNGATDAMVNLPGARISSAESSTGGFENKFLYLDAGHLEPVGSSLGGCAYRFLIQATARTTDGYNYLTYTEDQDLHYVIK
jgi:hypothetical protein